MNDRAKKIAIGAGGLGVVIILIVILIKVFSSDPVCGLSKDQPKKVEINKLSIQDGDGKKTFAAMSGYLIWVKKDGDKETTKYLETDLKSVGFDKKLYLNSSCSKMEFIMDSEDPANATIVKSIKVTPDGMDGVTDCTVSKLDISIDKSKKLYKCLDQSVDLDCVVSGDATDKPTVKLHFDSLEFAFDQDPKNPPFKPEDTKDANTCPK